MYPYANLYRIASNIYFRVVKLLQPQTFTVPHGIGKMAYPIAQNQQFRTVGERPVEHSVQMSEKEVFYFLAGGA